MNLAIPKLNPERSRPYKQAVSKYRCLVCAYGDVIDTGETVSQAAHLSWAGTGGRGFKVTDELIVPLCDTHHKIHDGQTHGGAMQGENFWKVYHIDPLPVARMLWERHGPAS